MHAEIHEREVTRRAFMSWAIVAIGGFITVVVGVPILGLVILPALRPTKANEVNAGPTRAFPTGIPTAATVAITTSDGWVQSKQDKGVWVVKKSETDFTVFSGRCTHLGCAYSWVAAQNQFICPCHGGHYSIAGVVLAGPPPRPLDTLNWRIDQGNLIVQYEEFRLGIPQKEVA